MSRTGDKRSPATLLIGIVQVVGGIAAGGTVGLCYLATVFKFQEAFGITPHASVAGFWMSWIVTFIVVFAICVSASVNRHTRWFGIAAAASFTLSVLYVALVAIAVILGIIPFGPS